MIIKTVLLGFVLANVPLDMLHEPGWHYTRYWGVSFEAWGTIEVDVSGKGDHKLRWDTRHEKSYENCLRAREERIKSPIPYGAT